MRSLSGGLGFPLVNPLEGAGICLSHVTKWSKSGEQYYQGQLWSRCVERFCFGDP